MFIAFDIPIFDILIYAIKNNAFLDIIKYIIEKTPYTELNYGVKEHHKSFKIPLFEAIAKNNFKIADLLIEKGADLNYEYYRSWCKVDDIWDYVFRYCGRTDQDTELDYYHYVNADVFNYLREFDCLNNENYKYLEKKGLSLEISYNQYLDDKRKEIEEREKRRIDLINKYFTPRK
ncbi:hypothetical protein BCR36DRAFT_588525 [Piromyces finnis]|uniref:Uncharacterized protein n=1 Tax=Piromyces finnis TaxID=1754191 RepID=A0A1Y1UB04_9FUNG|nr:hypothetical protein BCR36DRAFT_588525 [Piromyces finnis]|eukprot:ORX35199.1 hypothetical protein BCR36DRAFT_588525 [Piromyces finnis]